MAGKKLSGRTRPMTAGELEELNKIGFVWDHAKYKWDQNFAALKQYHEANGNCKVPKTLKTREGFGVYEWCIAQRRRRRKGRLSQDRVRKDSH